MIRFQDRRGVDSLRYRNRAEITVLSCEQKPVVYPIWISCQCMSYRLHCGHSLGGEGWGGYMSSLVLRRLHEFGRFISIACSSTRAQLHTFLCLAHLHASSLCIDCIFSAEGATRKLIKQGLPTTGYFHAFHCFPIFPRQSIYGFAGFFLNLVTF